MEAKRLYPILTAAFVLAAAALVIYFSAGQPSLTGQVTLNEREFNLVTPFGFNFSMLIVGAMAVMMVVFMIAKEGGRE